MFKAKRFVQVAALLVGMFLYQYAKACDQNCKIIQNSCFTDNAGNCQAGKCYQYYATGSDFTLSCWPCGGPGNGWCIVGDPSLRCVDTGQSINYKYYQSCTRSCNKANTYVQASMDGDPTTKTGTENRWVCNAK
jgi:hypothetical protein